MSNMQRILLISILVPCAVPAFILDAIFPRGIEIWMLNVPLILIPVLFRNRRLVIALCLVCSAMVVLGARLVSTGKQPSLWDILNRGDGSRDHVADRRPGHRHHEAIDSTRRCISQLAARNR